jgi:glycine/serine hydroxymethyltransferase
VEKSRFTGLPYDNLVDEIANAMRECNFSEEAIEKMRKNADEIDNELIQHMLDIVSKYTTKHKWNFH